MIALLLRFAALSLLAVGGGSAILPELQRQSVVVTGWLTETQFVDLYALTQVTPGPSMLLVCLIGYRAAGWPGSLVAAVGMFGPSSLLTLVGQRTWERLRQWRWRAAIERGLTPLAVGTVLSTGTLLARSADHGLSTALLTAMAAALIGFTRVGLLPIMTGAALLGWLGFV